MKNDDEIKTSITSLFYNSEEDTYRLADIDNGRLIPFVADKSRPRVFKNRIRLPFKYEGHGTFFCATWRTKQSDVDPSFDFVFRQLDDLPPKMYGVNDMFKRFSVRYIALALERNVQDSRVIDHPVFFRAEKSLAVLCSPCNVEKAPDGTVKLKDSIYTLPYYRLPLTPVRVSCYGTDFLYYPIYGDLDFCKEGECPVVSCREQIKRYIKANYLTKANLKNAGATRSEMQRFREVFESLKQKIDVGVLATEFCRDENSIRAELAAVCSDLDQMVNPSEIDEAFAKGLINSNGALSRQLMETWQQLHASNLVSVEATKDTKIQECQSVIADAERDRDRQLAEMKQAVEKCKCDTEAEISAMKLRIAEERETLEHIEGDIETKRKLLDGIREETASLLAQTRDTVAKALVTAQVVKAVTVDSATVKDAESVVKVSRDDRESAVEGDAYRNGNALAEEQIEDDTEWNLLCDNLEVCGVASAYRSPLAAVLLSAYRLRMPLLLAGPNGRAVADALSCVTKAQTADELVCEGDFNAEYIRDAMSGDGVLVVRGGLNSTWTDGILEAMSMTSRMVIFMLPLSDDLAMMPKGVLDYAVALDMQPIASHLTRSYVSKLFGKVVELPVEDGNPTRISKSLIPLPRTTLRVSQACESNLMNLINLATNYVGADRSLEDFSYSAIFYAVARISDLLADFWEHLKSHNGIAPSLKRFVDKEDS